MDHLTLTAQAIDSKERAIGYLHLFQAHNTAELRKRGYRPLPDKYRGISKDVYLSHDHVIKIGKNAEHEWRTYQTTDPEIRQHLVPTVRLGRDVILQPRGKPVAKFSNENRSGDGWAWRKDVKNMVMDVTAKIDTVIDDLHYGNWAAFGDTVLCIDFAGYTG